MADIFSTTFDDTNFPTVRAPSIHWEQTVDGLSDAAIGQVGDGLSGSGGWTTSNGAGDQILAAANNPAGGGGKGFRHWVGDGLNNVGGGISLALPSSQTELWIRYYIRFQSGFAWNGSIINMKTIYNTGSGTFYFGIFFDKVGGHVQNDSDHGQGQGNHLSSVTWAQWQGGSTGDGLFHCLELHVKINPLGAVADGVFEFWLDGAALYSNSSVKFSTTDSNVFNGFKVGENSNDPQNGGVDAYVDFDDIVISNSGYIGPLGGGAALNVDPETGFALGLMQRMGSRSRISKW